LYDYIEPVYD